MKLDEFFEVAQALARKIFDEQGELMPMFFLHVPPDSIAVVPCPWDSAAEQRAMVRAVKATIKEHGGVQHYCFASETWFTNEQYSDSKVIDFSAVTPPSESPNRKEGVIIVAEGKGGQQRSCMFEIKRDAKGTPTLIERDEGAAMIPVGGMGGMLGDEVFH